MKEDLADSCGKEHSKEMNSAQDITRHDDKNKTNDDTMNLEKTDSEILDKNTEISDITEESDVKKHKRKSKSFTGCYTCRRRKIACDLRRPTCLNCEKSGFVCEGYDIKLRWSQPIKFDKYGYQLPSKPIQVEYCQRRSIEYVQYPDAETYKYYDEMDTDLAKLHNKYIETKDLDTILEGHFGVFRGETLQPKKKRKRKQTSQNKNVNDNENCNDVSNIKKRKTEETQMSSNHSNKFFNDRVPNLDNVQSNNNENAQHKSIAKNKNVFYPQNISNSIVSIPNQFDSNNKGNEWLSTELLDAALLTASALNGDTHFLDMFDLDGGSNSLSSLPNATTGGNVNNNINATTGNSSNTTSNSNNTNDNNNNGSNAATTVLNTGGNNVNNITGHSTNEFFNEAVHDKMLHLLFQGRNTIEIQDSSEPKPNNQQNFSVSGLNQNDNNNNSYTDASKKSHRSSDTFSSSAPSMSASARPRYSEIVPEEVVSIHSVDEDGTINSNNNMSSPGVNQTTGIVPTTNLNNKFKGINQPVIDSEIKIHASNNIKMPQTIMEILENVPLPKSLAIDKFGIPTTSLNVHPMARYLLNYYIEDVADMMTVIPLAKNPWKFIYFPRALMAIGELASLGRTSNARNGLLNALLAVSAFNVQSKFERGSYEMKYYVDLGIQLRRQANEFVNMCMEEDILSQKYKDVLVAVLSMVTIDVVWGTMSSCKIHLDHCEKIIEKKMLHKRKLSSKAIILHRIFSSLKLIQDSTSLENIQKSEMFLNEKNYKNFLTGSKPTKEQLDELNKNNFRGIFRGSRMKSSRTATTNNTANNGDDDNSEKFNNSENFSAPVNSNRPDFDNLSVSSGGSFYNSRSKSGTSSLKRGKYNEKITDNGKVRIEFIVNNDESSFNDDQIRGDLDIPAFVDITRTSFKPSKNKLDDKVVSSDAIYGLPNSLILMFGEIVPLTRFKKYHEDHKIPLPSFFDELATQLEYKLLTWKLEWTLIVEDDNISNGIGDSVEDDKKIFISPRHEGIYHHVMSFYHALIIYFYRFIEDVNPMYLLERVEKVLYHLNKIQEILENNKETSYIIPLFWQGFIAGSEAMTLYLQNGFNKWGQDIAKTGIGTYWNARQIMLEIWRRKNHNVKNNSWVDVLRDWKTNVMLT